MALEVFETFRSVRGTIYVTFSGGPENIKLAITGKNGVQQREQECASLDYELLFAAERHSLFGHLGVCSLVLSQFSSVRIGQLDVAVQDVQDAFAFAIHEFLFTVRDYGLTQFRFGHLGYVKDVIIRFTRIIIYRRIEINLFHWERRRSSVSCDGSKSR